ncbi:aspartyl/asparaginyl beta-hydroxylase domain-containing protein [Ascidiimonas aurantiaca]|uniref:aspartyl/asparaginyl beta-hydroxylase domain-containing protein n=1 Tax=Ascidiimonas aurantiaca TaxID=1685432 RepID=UPI0030EF0F7E
MITSTPNDFIDKAGDRIQLPLQFDASEMLEDLKIFKDANFVYYDVVPLRAPAHLVDSTLPFPPPAENYADGTWTDWMDTPTLKKCPSLIKVIDTFKEHATVNLVRLLRLAPNSVVEEHVDPTLGIHIEESMVRLTIPIQTNDQVEFYLNNEIVPMKPGECWYLKLTDPHKVINNGPTERVNLTIDVIPNAWVRSMIFGN